MTTAVPAETIGAYLGADYIIDADPKFVLHIGERSEALAALYIERTVDCCAFITAGNPQGRPLSAAENAARQREFARELEQRGLPYLTGAGCDPEEKWEPEPSYLVLGVSLDEANVMGKQWDQNGIVWCGPDCVPQLVLLR